MIGSKRKATSEVAATLCQRSCKSLKLCTSSTIVVEEQDKACLDSLPREIFYNIVAYLGPTSSSLCSLAQVTHEYNSIMTSLGDVMLHRVLQYRTPLVANSPCESPISLFVRHARVSKAIQDKLEVLDDVLKKDFASTSITAASNEECHNFPIEIPLSLTFESTHKHDGRNPKIVQPSEVLNALNIALCLLGCTVHHYFYNAHDPKEATKRHAAKTAMERRISDLCSKIGAKAYNYAKSRMFRRQEREDQVFSTYYFAEDDESDDNVDVDDDDDDDDDVSIDPSEQEADDDVAILDKACLVMQTVVLRQQHGAAQRINY